MNDSSLHAPDESSKWRWPKRVAWLAAGLTAGVLLLFRLSDVAGLHRDEATFALVAQLIQDGFRPRTGPFNVYTAPIHSYIIAGFFSLLGESIWSLRLSGVLTNLLAAAALIDVVRRIDPSRALCTFWVLVTMPVFVIMSRMAGENFALNPLLLFGGVWLFMFWVTATVHPQRSELGFYWQGFCFVWASGTTSSFCRRL